MARRIRSAVWVVSLLAFPMIWSATAANAENGPIQVLTVVTTSSATDVTVSWTPVTRVSMPADAVIGYNAGAWQAGAATPASLCFDDGSTGATSCVLRGLKQGVTYDVKVWGCQLFDGRLHPATAFQNPYCHGALNTLGEGSIGYVSLCCQVPQSPRGVLAVDSGGGAATVSWTASAFLGGAAFVDYLVTTDPPSAGCTTTALTCTVSDLPFSRPITATVAARNSGGSSGGTAAAPVVLIAPRPGEPLRVTGKVAGTSRILVSWRAPLDAKKLAVTSYVVTSRPGKQTCKSSATRCTIVGLKRGIPYTFIVQAYRGTSGSGQSRPSGAVTIPLPPPLPIPAAPTPTTAPQPTPKPSATFG